VDAVEKGRRLDRFGRHRTDKGAGAQSSAERLKRAGVGYATGHVLHLPNIQVVMNHLKYSIFTLGALLALPFSLQAGPACCGGGAHAHGNPSAEGVSGDAVEDPRKAWVQSYEGVSEALVEDELDTAKEEAQGLARTLQAFEGYERIHRHAEDVAEAQTLEAARSAFRLLSHAVIERVSDHDGFHVMNCPMVEDGQWLQSEREVRNPYMGQRMVRCGSVARTTGPDEDGHQH